MQQQQEAVQEQNKADRAITESRIIGVPTPRIDGPLKTTGSATYTSDFHFPGMLFAWPVTATIASGTVTGVDSAEAERMPGVVAVYSRRNIGTLYRVPPSAGFSLYVDERRPPFADDTVNYYGQYVAVAVAKTLEQARAAAAAVKVSYKATPHNTEDRIYGSPLGKQKSTSTKRGDLDAGLAGAPVKLEALYRTPAETHNPMELHASVAVFNDGKYTLYETSQAVQNHRDVLAAALGVPVANVQVIQRFLGSGFGGKLWPWPHSVLAAACSRNLGRPVKLVVSRTMMFSNVGHRPVTEQMIRLGAEKSGRLVALEQDYVSRTSMLDNYAEDCGEATGILYSCPNVRVTGGIVRRNVGTPTAMRGPGAVPGLFALESAMDELAIQLNMDPIALRLLNEPEKDETNGLPFSSRHLKECLTTGAEKFGWSKRSPAVGSMKNAEGMTVGWGVAACSWIAARMDAEVLAELLPDGTVRVACGTQDTGGGTNTIMAQIVAHETGLPLSKIKVVLGDSSLPPGPITGGSMTTASVTPATVRAVQNAQDALLKLAVATQGSPFKGRETKDLVYSAGRVSLKGKGQAIAAEDVIRMAGVKSVIGNGKSGNTFTDPSLKYSFHSYGAQFAEVTWQPEIARLRVSRVVSVIDAGRMVNPKSARNQIEGALVMGVGMALLENAEIDQRKGSVINASLADYLVAVNADCPEIDVTFLDYPDYKLNPIGARGVGEIGLAGIAAAIANATYHATGVRVRELPIRIEDLLTAKWPAQYAA